MALGIGELLVHSFLYGLLKSLILEFDFGWRSGSSPAMQSCFQCPLHSLPKTLVSYQGIALAMPQVLRNQAPL